MAIATQLYFVANKLIAIETFTYLYLKSNNKNNRVRKFWLMTSKLNGYSHGEKYLQISVCGNDNFAKIDKPKMYLHKGSIASYFNIYAEILLVKIMTC